MRLGEFVVAFAPGIAGLVIAAGLFSLIALSSWRSSRAANQAAKQAPGTEVPRRLQRNERSMRVMLTVFGGVLVLLLEVVQFVPSNQVWLWWLSVLPALLVVHHGIQLAVFKNRRFFDEEQDPGFRRFDTKTMSIARAAMKEERQYYGTASLALRFALPALVLVLANLVVGRSLSQPPVWGAYEINTTFIAGAQVGAVGAYVYVLLFLGGRAVRGDITPSSVWWCAVTIVAGPLLGGMLRVMFEGELPFAPDSASGAAPRQSDQPMWSTLLLPFAAGFSLRYIVDFVNETIRRLIGGKTDAIPRSVPLTRLRGIDQDIEERLMEEGISDVANLAMANPTKLRRNTRFDKRQLLSWIDEALLLTYVPTSWQTLEVDGITGAVDLIWYAGDLRREDLGDEEALKRRADYRRIDQLATRNKLSPEALLETIVRMKDDAQVCLIRGLYQLDDTEAMNDDPLFRAFEPEMEERGQPLPQGAADQALGVQENATLELSVGGQPRAKSASPGALMPEQERERLQHVARCRGLFLVHGWRRSARPGQLADVVLRVVQDLNAPTAPVTAVEYCLGTTVSSAPVVKTNARDDYRLEVALQRPTLATARVTFSDGSPAVTLERYVDFETETARAS
jgi:uncharacterized protein YhhL (DUF1145 family)